MSWCSPPGIPRHYRLLEYTKDKHRYVHVFILLKELLPWLIQNLMKCNAVTPTATERHKAKIKYKTSSAATICYLVSFGHEPRSTPDTHKNSHLRFSLPPYSGISEYLPLLRSRPLLCVLTSTSRRQSNHCHEKNDRQRNNWGDRNSGECVITANHHNEGTGSVHPWWTDGHCRSCLGRSLQLFHQHALVANRCFQWDCTRISIGGILAINSDQNNSLRGNKLKSAAMKSKRQSNHVLLHDW